MVISDYDERVTEKLKECKFWARTNCETASVSGAGEAALISLRPFLEL